MSNLIIGIVHNLREIFWSPSFWLADGTKWQDLEPNNIVNYTDYRDLYWYPFIIASGILLIRFILERFVFSRLGLALGIKSIKLKNAAPNPILEKYYRSNPRWNHKDIIGLAKQLDWSERRVERWRRLRQHQGKPTTLVKFGEHSWRCFYYTNMFIYGLFVLWDKPWFWNIDYCWINYPHQGIGEEEWTYYMVSLGFYWSLMFSQFFDTKRKDFWQMFIHHIITILLLSFSWICNLHRIGTLILIIHDAADFLLDAGKTAKYAKCEGICTCVFIAFLVSWLITKLILFPRILLSTTLDAPRLAKQMFPAYYFFNGLLYTLMVIHLFWTYLIFQLASRTLKMGTVEDLRSSDNKSDESENPDSPTQHFNQPKKSFLS